MRTQSMDTRPEAERVLIEMIRKIPLSKRFDRVRSWTKNTLQMNRENIQKLNPDASREEHALTFVTHTYGHALGNSLRTVLKKRKPKISDTPDILVVMKSVVDVLQQLGITYYIGGSIASSMYGIVQAAQDIDLIANLQIEQTDRLLAQLQRDFYFDEEAVRDAIQNRTWFNAIHLESILKIDVFLLKDLPFDQEVSYRAQQHLLGENSQPFYIASPEDIILTQMAWHSRGGEVADDKWNDILGVLKVQGNNLDLVYLQQWATKLEIGDFLERACIDAGLKE